ncbi:unnamed protein product [Rotaria sordida]|uniref:Uncharacterized protein n=1 Tax=Rotaria sordida TaxID=392033 RepID=A0A814PQQ1_9BILA|nr:unnamed protein product [Rotaria sordida]CAF0985463.1 unnamed protein product [Rotaria sordida]CAF1002558.1 unnamed protein product [Rotaria sordida]CAF1109516.1 unnamed protein product [Rotaria sordida]CAF1109832.1 unnamed protein product [Rotaria sordida]
MTSTSSNINLLHIDEDSLLDNTTNNRKSPVKTSIPINIIPTRSDDVIYLNLQSHNNSKRTLRKKTLSRNLDSTVRPPSRSSTTAINCDLEKSRYHRHRYRDHYPSQCQHNIKDEQQEHAIDGCDMRIFIIRHGERVDRCFGSNWFMLAFDHFGQYHPYHTNLPPHLPVRSNPFFWAFDTPLTRNGLNAAQNVGRVLGINKFEPTHVYSSPAMRCILTTYQILKGLGLENQLPIRIEPGLLELGAARFGMSIFLKSIDWHKYGINVDLSYQPIIPTVPQTERANAYYLRSKYVIREIEQRHDNQNSPALNILIVGHATSPDTLTWDLVGRQPNIYDLFTLSLNIGYLQMVITERKKQNKLWSLTQMPLQATTLKWV